MKFTKMQGCGNDYVYINCLEETIENPSALAISMSNRHFGIGSDGLILILPAENADFKMRMYNADGSESEMCGNGIRCVGKYVYDKGLTSKEKISIDTLAGIKNLQLHIKGKTVEKVTVDMGEPILEADKIPVISRQNPVLKEEIFVLDRKFLFTCVSMGNPHAVTFITDLKEFPLEKYGSIIEIDSHFPKKTNVEFIEILDRKHLKMRVWERGTGETMACGTGACATAVAAVLNDYCDRKVSIELLGGELLIEWKENNHVYMTGPAEFSFDGVWLKK